MAIVSNTYLGSAAVGNREELSDMVNRITPEDTPIYSMIRKENASNTYCEWEVDELAAPAANAQIEGDQYSYSAVSAPARMGNHTQIFRKTFIISNTQQAIRNAGNIEKLKYQSLKKGIEIRKDVEFALVTNTASVKAASGTAPKFGSLASWIKTNVNGHAQLKVGGFSATTSLTVAQTAKQGQTVAQRAFTQAMMDDVMQRVYVEGGNCKDLVFSPYLKSVFIGFMDNDHVAAFRYNTTNGKGNRIIATADIYEGPYGMVRVVPNRVMKGTGVHGQASNAWFLDRKRIAFKWLRRIRRDRDITANADAKPYVIIGEGTLKITNEKALGQAANLFGTTAAT